MKHTDFVKTFVLGAAVALTLGVSPDAQAAEKVCSDATLKGVFAYTSTGAISAPPDLAGPFAETGLQTFDGKGGTTGSAMLSQNGNILQIAVIGTYAVNPDCTGTFKLQVSPIDATVDVYFVLDESGTEFQAIETDAGYTITRIGRRLSGRSEE